MFDTELYQQVLGLTASWKVTDVRLDVESTEIHVHIEHPEGCRWNCPHCSRELACYDHAPERQWRHLNTCQFHTLVQIKQHPFCKSGFSEVGHLASMVR